eukprot:5100456-Ditylum_brightwellii.AAC.1
MVVPLGPVEDTSVTALLSSDRLVHSLYKIQSIPIIAKETSTALTPSIVINSSSRVWFDGETSQNLTSGRAKGCLQWDAEAMEFESEINTLNIIDSVKVSKDIVNYVAGVTGAGIIYHITSTGANVRGNVGPLEVVDVGKNGCFDAHNSGGI